MTILDALYMIDKFISDCQQNQTKNDVDEPEAKFKEFDPRLKFQPRLKYGWFYLKLYSIF